MQSLDGNGEYQAPKAELERKQSLQSLIAEGDKVVAERFRTKMCHHFVEKGSCPYESRCMFAHGRHQLRTKHTNLRDGLVNEESIRQFKRGMSMTGWHGGRAATVPFNLPSAVNDSPAKTTSNLRSPGSPAASPIASDEGETPPRRNLELDLQFLLELEDAPRRRSAPTAEGVVSQWFRWDPYSPEQVTVKSTPSQRWAVDPFAPR